MKAKKVQRYSLLSWSAFTCLKLTVTTLEQGMKYVQRYVLTYFRPYCSDSIVNIAQLNAGWVGVGAPSENIK